MEIRARINPISYEKPLLKRTVGGNIVGERKKKTMADSPWSIDQFNSLKNFINPKINPC